MRIVRPSKRGRRVTVEAIPNVFYRYNGDKKRPEVVIELTGEDGSRHQICGTFPEWIDAIGGIGAAMKEGRL